MVLLGEMASGSSRPNAAAVKKQAVLARLFEGWQVGLAVVIVAGLAALIVVPRPVSTNEIPLPWVNHARLAAKSRRDVQRAEAAQAEPLPYEVRSLGEALRKYGLADAAGDTTRSVQLLTTVRQQLPFAFQHGDEAVLRLRAVQLSLFLQELAQFEKTGEESPELRAIGGGLVALARRAGWIRPRGKGVSLLPDRVLREVLFRKRWSEITGLQRKPFGVSFEEQHAFYRFLFEYPMVPVGEHSAKNRAARCRAANGYLLRKVEELGRIDPEYPTNFARGILLLRLNRPEDAELVLGDYIRAHPDGPYHLRVRNTFREAQERAAKRR